LFTTPHRPELTRVRHKHMTWCKLYQHHWKSTSAKKIQMHCYFQANFVRKSIMPFNILNDTAYKDSFKNMKKWAGYR